MMRNVYITDFVQSENQVVDLSHRPIQAQIWQLTLHLSSAHQVQHMSEIQKVLKIA